MSSTLCRSPGKLFDVLAEFKALNGNSNFVCASPFNPRKPISENMLLYGLYRLGYHSRMTGHGFRTVGARGARL